MFEILQVSSADVRQLFLISMSISARNGKNRGLGL